MSPCYPGVMATIPQINANRANALLSSGPTSPEGKATSRFNAAKHFIDAKSMVIPGEDPEQLRQLREDLFADLQPEGALESLLVGILVDSEWFRRRYVRIEAEVFPGIAKLMEETGATAGELFLRDAGGKNALGRLHSRQQAVKRDFNKALADLRRLRQER